MLDNRLILDLQLFAEGEAGAAGVEDAPAAGEQYQTNDVPAGQTGVDDGQAAAGPDGQKDVEKAFAKRLAAERSKWESELSEKLKDYEAHRRVSEFFQQYNGMDLNALMERIELEQLKQQAEQQQVPVEVMRRIQELEQKAALAEQLAQQHAQAQWEKTYRDGLAAYVQGKEDADPDAITKFLVDNGISVDPNDMNKAFDLAYKAIQFEKLQQQLASAEKDGMKKLLGAKGSIPANVGASSGQGQINNGPPKTFAEARARALARLGVTDI
jgi:hypothetical protein